VTAMMVGCWLTWCLDNYVFGCTWGLHGGKEPRINMGGSVSGKRAAMVLTWTGWCMGVT
jgi:hypothetical protein